MPSTGSTISKSVYHSVTLGVGIKDLLTITSGGEIYPSNNGATGLVIPAGIANPTVFNAGVIFGGHGGNSPSVINGGIGVYIASGATTAFVDNYGKIYGGSGVYSNPGNGEAGGAGVVLLAGTLLNDYIYAGVGGIYGGLGASNINGAGGAGGVGVTVGATAYLHNLGNIYGGNGGAGTLGAGGVGGTGVSLVNGLAFNDGGNITGGDAGLSAAGFADSKSGTAVDISGGTFISTGNVQGGIGAYHGGTGGAGVILTNGVVLNEGTAAILGGNGQYGGTFVGGNGGIGVYLEGGTLINAAAIGGGNAGGSTLSSGNADSKSGAAIDISGGTFISTGTVQGGLGLYNGGTGGAGLILTNGVVLNEGTGAILGGNGQYGGTVGGNGGIGVYLDGGTLINAATIGGGSAGGSTLSSGKAGDAIIFGALAGTLVAERGAVFTGAVIAKSGVADVLELAGTSGSYLGGLGTQVTNFKTIDLATGGPRTLAGNTAGLASGESIAGFIPGDTIILTGFAATPGTKTLASNATATLSAGVTLDLVGDAGKTITLASDGHGDTVITTYMPCFAAGTRILTLEGEKSVEDLALGDLVVTVHETGPATRKIIWLGNRTLDASRHPEPSEIHPIRILAGALGDNIPARDLRLSPRHALYINGHLVEAAALVNGRTIYQETATNRITYHHVELDAHDILLAEGCPAESFLDTGNKPMFAGGEVTQLHPDFRTQPGPTCAPYLAQGPALLALRHALATRALPALPPRLKKRAF